MLSVAAEIPVAPDFDYWWNSKGESVEPPNLRRNGESGVERLSTTNLGVLYIKRQRNHLFRDLRHPLGLPTVMREKFATVALNRLGIATPEVVFAEARKTGEGWQAVLVTKELTGYADLENWYRAGGRQRIGEVQHQRLLMHFGSILGVMHRQHWQHSCLYPKHVFLTAGDETSLPDVAMLDLEKIRRRLLPGHAARRDLDQLRRHSRNLWNEQDWQALLAGHNALV